LLVAPIPPLGLPDKQRVTELLLQCGADITEVNVVRKHLSAVKGGRLLRLTHGRPVVTLILSDVVGDDPATVGSGPTVPDESTFEDAVRILKRHGIFDRCPASVRDVLESGVRGEVPETVRPGEGAAVASAPIILGSNADARTGAARAASRLGYAVHVRDQPLVGTTVAAARQWLHEIQSAPGRARCFIAGGETTVRVRGPGKGGRNQEFALALVEPLAGTTLSVLSAGTDGIDGPTDAAGAVVDSTTLGRAGDRGMRPADYLDTNDSYHFFEGLGDLVMTGPTGTNVMDLKIALVGPTSDV
jgi:glycerate-2-kinase